MNNIKSAFFFEDYGKNVYSGRFDGDIMMWEDIHAFLGGNGLCMIDVSTDLRGQYYTHLDGNTTYEYFTALTEVEDLYPDASYVYLEAPSTLSTRGITPILLPDYVHPITDQVIYVYGSDSAHHDLITGREDKNWVSFPLSHGSAMWAVGSMSIVLYDRMVKGL